MNRMTRHLVYRNYGDERFRWTAFCPSTRRTRSFRKWEFAMIDVELCSCEEMTWWREHVRSVTLWKMPRESSTTTETVRSPRGIYVTDADTK